MIKKIILIGMLCVSPLGFLQIASAKDLPDFTELAEKQGATVVNITVTMMPQTMAQDDDRRTARSIFFRNKRPACHCPRS